MHETLREAEADALENAAAERSRQRASSELKPNEQVFPAGGVVDVDSTVIQGLTKVTSLGFGGTR